jgi:hypothetical protein
MDKFNQVFWGEVAPCDHLLQIYESDDIFLHALEGFTATGLLNGDSIILIASETHLEAIEIRLKENFDLNTLKLSGQYISYDAEEALSQFIVDNDVDEARFKTFINGLLKRARIGERKVRAFGEMVALLWGQGNRKATIKLEALWSEICKSDMVCLYCAYPQGGFRQDVNESIEEICSHHTKMIERNTSATEINLYGEKLSMFSLR